MARAYVGLGANLGAPAAQIASALRALAALPRTRLLRRSSLYRSRPMGPSNQPPYANAVALLETFMPASALLDALLAIERGHGRVRDAATRNGPRSLDLDLLLYDALVLQTPGLTLPHPGAHRRDFVLVPLLEIWPEAAIPGHGPAQALLAGCAGHDLAPWPDVQTVCV